MGRAADEVLKDALELPIDARAALINSLPDSLDSEVDPDAEKLWQAEILRRTREIDEGSVRLVHLSASELRSQLPGAAAPQVACQLEHPSEAAEELQAAVECTGIVACAQARTAAKNAAFSNISTFRIIQRSCDRSQASWYVLDLENFFGNAATMATLTEMSANRRIPQTLLLSGPEGVGKATLARRFASLLVGAAGASDAAKIERDDLSLEANLEIIADREKWPSDKRNEDPLFFSSHPDVLTFAPDGPLRQITIQQMRLLKDRASLKPLKGAWRVFLIDDIDRANEQAANSLLKTLEEPPPHLILIMTARNPYDLLATIRSRAVPFGLSRLTDAEMRAFAAARQLDHAERRLRLAEGSPGVAVSLDLETYDRRRDAMLALLRVASGLEPFGTWLKHSDSIAARRTEKLDSYLDVLYVLLEDVLRLSNGVTPLRNEDVRGQLEPLARRVSFDWLRAAVCRVDQLVQLVRRNIQKSIALDAFATEMRSGV